MPTEIEIAWAAGLFEGEGCFDASGGQHAHRPRATMSLVDTDVLDKFVRIVGVGKVVPITPRQATHQWAWQWYTTEEEFYVVANMLRPHLGKRRAQAIDDCIAKRAAYVQLKTTPVPCKVCSKIFERAFVKGKPVLFCSTICRVRRNPPMSLIRAIARPETFG